MKKLILLSVIALFLISANAQQTVDELNKLLEATNAGWVAKESYLTHMNPIERQKNVGSASWYGFGKCC